MKAKNTLQPRARVKPGDRWQTVLCAGFTSLGLWIVLLLGSLGHAVEALGATPDVFYVPGTTRKICQLVGDWDWERNAPTENLTDTRYHLWGTDLGVPFAHNGRTYLVFGDTLGGVSGDRDAIAWTTDTDPEDGVLLNFLSYAGTWRPITIPGIAQGSYDVPLDGVSVSNRMYLWHSSDTMGSSWVAVSEDDGWTFRLLYRFSPSYAGCPSNFINVSVVKVNLADWPGFPQSSGDGVVIFGSGIYRASDVRLAFMPAGGLEVRSPLSYFAGLDGNGNPQWSSDEAAAAPLFTQGCVGELSVSYNKFIKRWILTYNCDPPRGINFRTAPQPWGPWSDTQVVFEPWQDGGYSHFMHVNWTYKNLDGVQNPGRENEWGGEYGPYQFRDLAVGSDNRTTLYFTMSTWNPYTVVLQKTDLVLTNRPVIVMPPADQSVSVGEPAAFEVVASAVGPLAYTWQRSGTNIPGATSNVFVFTPSSAGDEGASFRCAAHNSYGNATSPPAMLYLVPSGTVPVPLIAAPAPGAQYRAGDTIVFNGSATDAENGMLPASAFRWNVIYYHSNYSHSVFGTLSGATNGSFTVPLRGETDTNGWYRLRLMVEDSSGRSRSTFVDLYPQNVLLSFATVPPGQPVTYDGRTLTTPANQLALVGSAHTIGAATSVLVGSMTNDFMSWSDGGAISHSIFAPTYNTNYTAAFRLPFSLVARGSYWKYLATGVDPGTTWMQLGFNDSGWPGGPAQLGFGDGDEATVIASNRQVTTYFRRTWQVQDPAVFANLLLRVLRDDGVQVYLNGTEIYRNNIGGGNLGDATLAYTNATGADRFSNYYPAIVSPGLLRSGTNVLAAAIHQFSANSSDLSFDLELRGVEFNPVLGIEPLSNSILLFWPVGWTGYRVEGSTQLQSPTNWGLVSVTMATNGAWNTATVAPGAGQRFFRLRKP